VATRNSHNASKVQNELNIKGFLTSIQILPWGCKKKKRETSIRILPWGSKEKKKKGKAAKITYLSTINSRMNTKHENNIIEHFDAEAHQNSI
jgi:hypothetical protein